MIRNPTKLQYTKFIRLLNFVPRNTASILSLLVFVYIYTIYWKNNCNISRNSDCYTSPLTASGTLNFSPSRLLDTIYGSSEPLKLKRITIAPSFWMVLGTDLLSKQINHGGDYPSDTMNTLRVLLPKISKQHKSCVFFDVGCNIGALTLLASSAGCNVHAFDVQDFAVALAQTSVYVNGFDAIVNLNAVSNVDGEKLPIFIRNSENLGMTTVVKDLDNLVGNAGTMVETISLDRYSLLKNIKHINVLKIDVEGAEFDVIRGATNLFDNYKVDIVSMELWHQHAVETLEFFFSRNYKAYKINKYPDVNNWHGSEISKSSIQEFMKSFNPPVAPNEDVIFV